VRIQRANFSYAPTDRHAAPAVSIITALAETGPGFQDTVASVLGQSLQQWEWIIADATPDRSASVPQPDSRIRTIPSDPSRSLAGAWDLAAAEARARFLVFLESGVLFEPTALEKWLWFLKSRPEYGAVSAFQAQFRAAPNLSYPLRFADAEFKIGIVPEYLIRRPGRESAPELRIGELRRVQSVPAPGASVAFENRLKPPSDRRRLLVLAPHLALGGADKFTLDLVAELTSKHRYEVTIVTTARSAHPWRHRFEALTPDVFTFDSFLLLNDLPRFITYLIRSRAPQSVLITHSEVGYRLLPYLRARFPDVAFYDYVHIEEPAWKCGGYPAMSVAAQSFLDHSAASSHHLRKWMEERGGSGQKISVITTNVDSDLWRRDRYDSAALRQKWNVPADTPVILFAGRLCPQKQPDILARTVQLLDQRGVRFLCLAAGTGEDELWLREFIRRENLPSLRLLGAVPNEEIRELLAISDLFFLPSRHEGIAFALYEAMAMEVVPVSADVGGQSELVTSECGVLIAPGPDQVAEYADQLEMLLANTGRRTIMAAAARKRVEESYLLEQMGNDMAALFERECDVSRKEAAPVGTITDASWVDLMEEYRPIEASCLDPGTIALAIRMLSIARPLVTGQAHRKNRRLLLRILGNGQLRRRLLDGFDDRFYCLEYPDVPRTAPFPLLHYIFYGYREGRLPSATFDIAEAAVRPEADEDVNPLLLKIGSSLRTN
jgi:glycosyltransferase involved in cell wall biosynthesis